MPERTLRDLIKWVEKAFPDNRNYWMIQEGWRFPEDAVRKNGTIKELKKRLRELQEKGGEEDEQKTNV